MSHHHHPKQGFQEFLKEHGECADNKPSEETAEECQTDERLISQQEIPGLMKNKSVEEAYDLC